MSAIRPGRVVAGLPYITSFATTENPLSDTGKWRNGLTNGTDWQNMKTVAGNVVATAFNTAPNIDDSIACLDPIAVPGFSGRQYAQGVVFLAGGYAPSDNHEIELHLCCTITAGSVFSYEFLINVGGSYDTARWFGALGNVVSLGGSILGPGPTAPSNGTIFRFERETGGVFLIKQDGVSVFTFTDNSHSTGTPGLAAFVRPGTTTLANYGWQSYEAGNLP